MQRRKRRQTTPSLPFLHGPVFLPKAFIHGLHKRWLSQNGQIDAILPRPPPKTPIKTTWPIINHLISIPFESSFATRSFTGQSLPISLPPILGRNLAGMSSLWPFCPRSLGTAKPGVDRPRRSGAARDKTGWMSSFFLKIRAIFWQTIRLELTPGSFPNGRSACLDGQSPTKQTSWKKTVPRLTLADKRVTTHANNISPPLSTQYKAFQTSAVRSTPSIC